MDVGSHGAGATVRVTGGDLSGRTFVCTSALGTDVVGTHAITFQQTYTTASDVEGLVTKQLVDSLGINATLLNGLARGAPLRARHCTGHSPPEISATRCGGRPPLWPKRITGTIRCI